MKNRLKRISALLLSFIMLSSCVLFNFESVFANLQTHVRDVVIRVMPSTDRLSNINLSWTNPQWSTVPDGAANEGDKEHPPEGYRIMERNLTAGDSNFINVSDDLPAGDPPITTATISRNLTTGSLYMYRVMPFHKHTYFRQDNTVEVREAPYDNTSPEEVLFMSDLEVTAHGSGDTLTVTWDNPLFNNRNIFSGYRIYYQRGGASVTNFNNYKDVSIDNEELIVSQDSLRKGVSRLTYTIYDASLAQSEVYAVKVEPLYAGSEIRKLTNLSYAEISINDKIYKLGFNAYSTNEYRTNNAYIAVPLEILENGKDYLNLHWWGLSTTLGNIEKIEVYKGPSETDIGVNIGTIFNTQAVYVNYWQIDKPTEITYYQIRIFVEGMDVPVLSEIAMYDPNIVNITPNKPRLLAQYNAAATTNTIDAYWTVFMRYPYTDSENEFADEDGMYIDKNVKYDLWITDSLENLNDPNLPKTLDSVTPAQLTQTNIEGVVSPVYHSPLTTYTGRDSAGGFVTKPIAQNKVYYLKIVASKPIPLGDDLTAAPAYASEYFPARGDIATPQSLNKPPLKIREDEDGKELITNNSIEVEWKTRWFEVYDEKTDSWYTKVSVDDSVIHFGDEATTSGAIDFCDSASKEAVREKFKNAGVSEDAVNLLPVRQVDLRASDIKYEMIYLPYKDISSVDGGYESYLEQIMNDENAGWQEITPEFFSDIGAAYKVEGLEKNTTYAIIIRPYRILEDGQKDAYPSYVMGTTLPDDVKLDITPTVPVLEEETHDDMSITVKWQEYIDSLEYELSYSTDLLSDPNAGTIINMEEILRNGERKTEEEIKRIFYRIRGLMPETGYYIWIRANVPNDGEPIYSSWSSPIYVITSELGKPEVPDGLGLISKDSLNIYNKGTDTKYSQRTGDYIIVEWNRNQDDLGPSPAVAATGEGYEVLVHPDIQSTIITKLNNLIPNTDYYARVKARCTVSLDSEGNREKLFTYILQFSVNRDFKDALTIVIPDGPAEIEETQYTKESDWSSAVRFKAGKTDDEYDGDIIDSHYPLPDDDFEYIYDGFTNTLTYRFRSDKEDLDGLDDNFVDQRFISTLIKKQLYAFEVDLTYYNNYTIKNRVVEIPYSIMEAFGEHDVTLYFKADNVTFGLSPDFVRTNEVNSLAGYGKGASVRITASSDNSGVPMLGYGQSYISSPQKLSVDIVTPEKTLNLKQFYKDVSVAIKLNDRYTIQETNVGAYYDTDLTADWQRYTSMYDEVTGTFIGNTKIPAAFSAIRKNAPSISSNDANAVNSLVNLNSRIAITDLQYAKPNSVVSTVQFNNIVAAVANGRKDVAVNGALSDDDYKALSRKGMLINSATVSREEGINILVKLYETKTGRKAAYTPINLTPYTDISGADPKYVSALLKAGDLGFYGNTYGARPKDTMSFADLLYMVDIIIRDGNL